MDDSSPPRTAVITGGQGTLAKALAHELSSAGYLVEAPGRLALDVADQASVSAFFARMVKVDLLVCAAGMARDKLAVTLTTQDWNDHLAVNLDGAFRCAMAATPKMSASRNGHIVFVSSHSALAGNAGQTAYAASKSALAGLTKSLAKELGPRGLRVNCLLPGFFDSKMTHSLSEAARTRILEAHCLSKTTPPRDAARFLRCLDEMHSVSGQVFQLDSRITPW